MSPRAVLSALLLLLGLSFQLSARADDLVTERGVLSDPGGRLTVSEAVAGEYLALDGRAPVDLASSVQWLRLRVRAPASGRDVVLRIRPATLDQVWLHVPDAGPPDAWPVQKIGDQRRYQERDCSAATLCFLVEIPAQGRTLYLRVESSNVIPVGVEAVTPAEARRIEHIQDVLHALFLGVMLWALMWALHAW